MRLPLPAAARPLLLQAQVSVRKVNRLLNRALLGGFEAFFARRRATPLDIYFAYRLLLGRAPDADGFLHHRRRASRLGIPLEALVENLLESEEFRLKRGALHAKLARPDAERPPLEERIVSAAGLQFAVDVNDRCVGGELARKGTYEPFVTWALQRLLSHGDSFLDVGANIGYFSVLAARQVGPSGRVFAVEPMETNYALLEKSAALNGLSNIELFKVAVGEEEGLAKLGQPDRENSGSFVLLGERPWRKATYEVPVRRLDALVGERRLHVVKMDVEGAEGLALRGMTRILERDRPALLLEYTPSELQRVSGVSGPELLGALERLGYRAQEVSTFSGALQPQTPAELDALLAQRQTGHLDLVLLHAQA